MVICALPGSMSVIGGAEGASVTGIGVALTELDSGSVPNPVTGAIVQAYSLKFVRLPTLIGEPMPIAVSISVRPEHTAS